MDKARSTLAVLTPFLAVSTCLTPTWADVPELVQTRAVPIEYAVNREAEPLRAVTIWATADAGTSWSQAGTDADRISPAMFQAPGDGEFGLFLVLDNAAGTSSPPPTAATQPHLTVVIDETPPVVQLHALQPSIQFGSPVVQVRWTAVDAVFSARPIEIQYHQPSDMEWRQATQAPIANTGRYDWTPLDDLHGLISMRVIARDRGGHVTESEARSVDLGARNGQSFAGTQGLPTHPMPATGFNRSTNDPEMTPAVSGSPRARDRAVQLMSEAKSRQDSGDTRGAIARYRDAVRLDPGRTDAFADMARLFYGLGEWDRALQAYDIVLQQEPRQRDALLGSALANTQRKDYAAAGEKLRLILRYDPRDAEVWMSLGDVAIYSGDEILARDCFKRAAEIDPSATRIVEDANKRLRLMDEVSRRYSN